MNVAFVLHDFVDVSLIDENMPLWNAAVKMIITPALWLWTQPRCKQIDRAACIHMKFRAFSKDEWNI